LKRASIRRTLHGLLTLTALCGLIKADARGPAPPFAARTLDGETFTNESVTGKVTLLQFWVTWCQYCRRDQPAVDNLQRSFANKGLVVLAVDADESEATVRKYLRGNPRSARVVVNDGPTLAEQFGAHGYPYYVVIDRNGNIAGTQSGSGGEASLRQLLRRAGLSSRSDTLDAGNQNSVLPASTGKLIEVPRARRSTPAKPAPKTIFVYANGERLEADHYTLDATSLHVLVDGEQRTIALSELDMSATIAVNRERGIDLTVPKNRSEVVVAF
jgi:thiol-disulfide isomerase/thioredoxin